MNRENSSTVHFFYVFSLIRLYCRDKLFYIMVLLQASMLDLLTLTRINTLRKLVTIIFHCLVCELLDKPVEQKTQ